MSTIRQASAPNGPAIPQQRAPSNTRRFNGMERTAKSWDGVRKDQELWQEDADCLIYYYARGSSQRGPSLKVPFAAVKQSRSSFLLDQCLVTRDLNTSSPTSDSGYDTSESSDLNTPPKMQELYLPAPPRLSREQAYAYHVTTRNYFAFLTGQALVGDMLGLALADLWERANQWQDRQDTPSRLLSFCEKQGYLSLVDSPHYATAVLNLADRAKLRDIWINAFTHCVGMHDRLSSTCELVALKNTTKALITRASLEMDLHIARVVKAVSTFLEDEFGTERLGLSKPARDHLDHFRSFLHTYYVDKLGYFPPGNNEPFDKRLWVNMSDDFRSLYDHLVDTNSDGGMTNIQSDMSGGVCVLQNVQAFDQLNGYEPLPHPLPLLPRVDCGSRSIDAQRSLRTFKLGRSEATHDRKMPPRVALSLATNAFINELKARPIVQEYQRFERQKLEGKLNVAEARKVRWLLIYGVLQMLISITKVPQGVDDSDEASYPLCALVNGCPPWDDEKSTQETPAVVHELGVPEGPQAPVEDSETVSIRPDCDAENAQDYFSLTRHESSNTEDMTPAPLRITVPLSRTASIRTSVGALQRSVAGSFSRRNSRRKFSYVTPQKVTSHNDTTMHGHSHAGNEDQFHSEALQSLEGMEPQTATPDNFGSFDFGLVNGSEEPVLENHQLDGIFGMDEFRPSYVPSLMEHQLDNAPAPLFSWMPHGELVGSPVEEDSPGSTTSRLSQSASARSSYDEHCSTPTTNRSSWTMSEPSTAKTSLDYDKSFSAFPMYEQHDRQPSYAQRSLNFGASCTSLKSLNAGTYRPTGTPRQSLTPAVSKYASPRWREESVDSVRSVASSQYPAESRQADEIQEEEMRGRRRIRAWDGFSFDD